MDFNIKNKKIVIICNPSSGNRSLEKLKEELITSFSGYDYKIWETQHFQHAIDLAKQAVKMNFDMVIAVGGDGTVIEVITGMIHSNLKLGIIPFGTGNMLANGLGIPTDPKKAIEIIMNYSCVKIDIGKINDKYFAFMAGCGLDAKIMSETPLVTKKLFGVHAYVLEGVKQAFTLKHSHYKIKLDNNKIIKKKAMTVLIANNGSKIGNLFSFNIETSFSNGLLDLIIISPNSILDYLPILWEMITKQSFGATGKVHYYKAKEIEIISRPKEQVQADGDVICNTPVKIKVIPNAIEILIPNIKKNENVSDNKKIEEKLLEKI